MNAARFPRTARAVGLVACALLVVALAAPPGLADTQAQLDAAQKQLKDLVTKVDAENAVVLGDEAAANVLAQQIDAVQSQLSRTQSKVVGLEQDIRHAIESLQAVQAQLDDRAWAAYESGPGNSMDFVLGATSLADLNERLAIVNNAAASDEDLITQIHAQRVALSNRQTNLEILESKQQAEQAQLTDEEGQAQVKLADAQTVLATLNSDKAKADALVNKLKKQRAAEIAAEKAALAALDAGGAHGGPSISGVLLRCPVQGPHAYSDDFGAPRFSGGFHLHAGNDILAPLGTPIVAPFPGTATASPNGLGGNAVIVTGAIGYVYNAHLDRYGKLGAVTTGDVIGYVGNTGDAAGGPTHDHFEFHPNVIPANPWKSPYGATVVNGAIDPYPFLNSVC